MPGEYIEFDRGQYFFQKWCNLIYFGEYWIKKIFFKDYFFLNSVIWYILEYLLVTTFHLTIFLDGFILYKKWYCYCTLAKYLEKSIFLEIFKDISKMSHYRKYYVFCWLINIYMHEQLNIQIRKSKYWNDN